MRWSADFRIYKMTSKDVFPLCGIANITTIADTKNPDLTVPIPEITEPLPPLRSQSVLKQPCLLDQLPRVSVTHLSLLHCCLACYAL
ncbi:hypothetical protein OS493_024430 [Desmophyllum pertusum]|uniref:Uncharacterized protein n=1 Tax=Desmophyllum pertusum TaxID=174260 RepID=A0A9X0CJ33_9CNID|nr:hypothetical protein OS493_024430 [Desmophyllum pertusum]